MPVHNYSNFELNLIKDEYMSQDTTPISQILVLVLNNRSCLTTIQNSGNNTIINSNYSQSGKLTVIYLNYT
jgi:hypothetical protein